MFIEFLRIRFCAYLRKNGIEDPELYVFFHEIRHLVSLKSTHKENIFNIGESSLKEDKISDQMTIEEIDPFKG